VLPEDLPVRITIDVGGSLGADMIKRHPLVILATALDRGCDAVRLPSLAAHPGHLRQVDLVHLLIPCRSRGGKCCPYRCHKPADGDSVWVVIRIGFDQGHANHPRVGYQGSEQRRDMVQSHARPIRRNVGQRQLESIQS
jgi:hypothetical protein